MLHNREIKLNALKEFFGLFAPLVLPIMIQNILMSSFRLVDTIMIGQLGDVAVAGVGLAGQVSYLVETAIYGFTSGSAVFITQYHGARDTDGICRSMGACMLSSIPICAIIGAGCFIFPEKVMSLLNYDSILIGEGAAYLRFAGLAYITTVITQIGSVTLRSIEQVKLPVICSGISSLFNIIINYWLIFGGLGVRPMGVAGAGLATFIASVINAVLLYGISAWQKNILLSPVKKLFAVKGFLVKYWKKAFPVLINDGLFALGVVILNLMLSRLGIENYAALTVVRTIENFIYVVFYSINTGCMIVVGKSVGENKTEEAKNRSYQFLLLSFVLGIMLGVVMAVIRLPLLAQFDISSAASHTAGIMLLFFCVDMVFRNFPLIFVVGISRAGGDTMIGLIGDAVASFLIVIPLVFVTGFILELPFIIVYLIMLIADDMTKFAIYIPYYLSWKWIKPVTEK